ncbi:hypothetical protein EU528_08295 [Candidatus Thorarchaeota archaeon]|nr:MAG: hypothetical protein EU528_08295 [Candidatus Thorarchaeota archaeon]
MPSRFVHGARLSRARKISDKSLVEFEVLSENPVVAYALIQGSGSEPYTVIIDDSQGIVAHTCPDFNKGIGWCKHLGKLLLKLPEGSINNLNKSRLREIRSYSEIRDHLERLREKKTLEAPSDVDVSLDEQIHVLAKSLENGKTPLQLIERVRQGLKDEIEKSTPNLVILKINSMTKEMSAIQYNLFLKQVGDVLRPSVQRVYNHLIECFWTTSTLYRLELAYLLSKVPEKLKAEVNLTSFQQPEDLSVEERTDARIVLSILTGKNIQSREFSSLVGDIPEQEKISVRLIRAGNKVVMAGTSVEGLKSWLQNEIKVSHLKTTGRTREDDLLIYILQTNGEKPKLEIKFNHSRDFTGLPVTVVETNPALDFVIQRIKTSERDYITRGEHSRHRMFFKWLEDKSVESSWSERTRARQADTLLSQPGIIIQWDICVNGQHPELLHVDKGEVRYTPDISSHIHSQLQPFDMTLCHPSMKQGGEWTKIAKPIAILIPDQVIDLVLRGTPVISTVLPWNVLMKFAHSGHIESGEVEIGIRTCQQRRFVYGSIALEKALEELSMLGKSGLSDEFYAKAHDELKTSSGRLNTSTRPIARKILVGEGKSIQALLAISTMNETTQLGYIVRAAKEAKDIGEFRIKLVQFVAKELLKGSMLNRLTPKLLNELTEPDLGVYSFVSRRIKNDLNKAYVDLRLWLTGKSNPTRRNIHSNIIGALMLEELKIPKMGALTDEELAALRIKHGAIAKHFT